MLSTRTKTIVEVGLCALVVGLVGGYVVDHWQAVRAVHVSQPLSLVPAGALGLVALFCVSWVCQSVLAIHGFPVRYSKAIGLFFVPMVGKYVPGKVWAVLAGVWLYGREGIPKRIAVTIMALLTLISVVSATFVGMAFGVRGSGLTGSQLWVLAGFLVALLLVAQPCVFYGGANRLLRLLGREPIQRGLSFRALLVQLLVQSAAWLMYGTGFFFLVCSVHEIGVSHLPQVCGIFALAQVAGLVALFAPAGIGVREGVLIAGLSLVVGSGPAILVAGVARVWQTVLESLMAGIGWRALRRAARGARGGPG